MSRFSLPAIAERAGTTKRPTWVSVLGLVLVPFVIAGVLVWALWNPQTRLNTVSGAIVNLDRPVTVNGQVLPLGRELAGGLVGTAKPGSAAAKGNYTWTITDASDAASGLASGEYAAVITIPKGFSKAATSVGGKPADAQTATIEVQTSPKSKILDTTLSATIAQTAAAKLGNYVTSNYLDNVYLGFNTLSSQLGSAASGAKKLATGGTQLSSGASSAASGTASLASGAAQAASGASQYASGVGQYTGGVQQLAAGLSQYSAGAQKYATGAASAASGAAQLSSTGSKLSDGASSLASGTTSLSAGLSALGTSTASLPSATAKLNGGVDAVNDGLQQLVTAQGGAPASAVDACEAGSLAACQAIASTVQQLAASTPQLAAGLDQLSSSAPALASGISELSSGASKLAGGAASLSTGVARYTAGASELAGGVKQLSTGAAQLSTGAAQLSTGAQTLAANGGQLTSGASQLASGTSQLASGTSQLASGQSTLASGIKKYVGGTSTLASGLSKAATSIPSYSAADRQKLSTVVTTPVATTGVSSTLGFGSLAAPAMAMLALWLGALASFIVLRPFSAAALGSAKPSLRLVLRGFVIPGCIALLQGAAVAAALEPLLKLDAAGWFGMLGISAFAGLAFAAVNQALIAIAGGVGRFVSMIVILLGLATEIVSTAPALLSSIVAWTPIGPAQSLLRVIVQGTGGSNAVGPIVLLVLWTVGGFLASTLAASRRRTVPAAELTPAAA